MTKRSAGDPAPEQVDVAVNPAPAPETAPAAAAEPEMPSHGGAFIRQPDGSLTLDQEA